MSIHRIAPVLTCQWRTRSGLDSPHPAHIEYMWHAFRLHHRHSFRYRAWCCYGDNIVIICIGNIGSSHWLDGWLFVGCRSCHCSSAVFIGSGENSCSWSSSWGGRSRKQLIWSDYRYVDRRPGGGCWTGPTSIVRHTKLINPASESVNKIDSMYSYWHLTTSMKADKLNSIGN